MRPRVWESGWKAKEGEWERKEKYSFSLLPAPDAVQNQNGDQTLAHKQNAYTAALPGCCCTASRLARKSCFALNIIMFSFFPCCYIYFQVKLFKMQHTPIRKRRWGAKNYTRKCQCSSRSALLSVWTEVFSIPFLNILVFASSFEDLITWSKVFSKGFVGWKPIGAAKASVVTC